MAVSELEVRDDWRVLLVGACHFDDDMLDDLPAVAQNLEDLRAALTDPERGAIRADHIVEVFDPRTPAEVFDAWAEVIEGAPRVVLVYYAGHGVIDQGRATLHLAVQGTRTEESRLGHTAVPAEELGYKLSHQCHAATKVLILDCCYSGRGLGTLGDRDSVVGTAIDHRGTVAIASSGRTETSKSPPGQRHTAFTGALLSSIEKGAPDLDEDWLDVETLFNRTRGELASRRLPIPQIKRINDAHRLPVVRNRRSEPEPPSQEARTAEVTGARSVTPSGSALPPSLAPARRRTTSRGFPPPAPVAWPDPLESTSAERTGSRWSRREPLKLSRPSSQGDLEQWLEEQQARAAEERSRDERLASGNPVTTDLFSTYRTEEYHETEAAHGGGEERTISTLVLRIPQGDDPELIYHLMSVSPPFGLGDQHNDGADYPWMDLDPVTEETVGIDTPELVVPPGVSVALRLRAPRGSLNGQVRVIPGPSFEVLVNGRAPSEFSSRRSSL